MSTRQKSFLECEHSFNARFSDRNVPTTLAMLLLATDCTLEKDWRQLSGKDLEIFSARMEYRGDVSIQGLVEMEKHISQGASLLVPAVSVDVLAFGCTSASMLIGEERISELMTRHRPGVPVTNPWTAAKAALRELGANRIAVLSPYVSEVNKALYRGFCDAGLEVVTFGAFQLSNDFDIYRLSSDSITGALSQMLKHRDVDAVFLSCTNLQVLGMLSDLESRFSVPFISSNQALFWHALRLAGQPVSKLGFGQLLDPDLRESNVI